MLSTKMMPAVGVLVPIYIIFKNLGLLDNVFGLIIIYTLMNLPIAVWMSYTYFCEIPAAILEAGRIDGATLWQEIWHLLRPMTLPGLSSTGLIPDYFCLERGFLEYQPHERKRGTLDRIYRFLFEPGRPFLRQTISGLFVSSRPHHGARLADAETVSARSNFRSGGVGKDTLMMIEASHQGPPAVLVKAEWHLLFHM